MKWAGIIFFSLIGLFLVALIFDAGCGQTRFFECQVVAHSYEPPWTETYSTSDSDGHQTIHSVQHDEVFHLICTEDAGETSFDCISTRTQYNTKTNGQEVTVLTRIGRWTGKHWLPTVQD